MKSRFIIRFIAGPLHDKSFEIGEGERLLIGKSDNCNIRIDSDGLVSRNHAQLSYEKGILWIEDSGSRNGTFVNGKRVSSKTMVRPNDKVSLVQLSSFQCSHWNALEPSRFASVVMTRVTDVAARMKRRPKASILPQFLAIQGVVVVVIGIAWWSGKQLRLRASQQSVEVATNVQQAQSVPVSTPVAEKAATVDVPEVPRNFIWDEIVLISQRFGDTPPSAMDVAFQEKVEGWIERFTKYDAHKTLFERKQEYWPTILSALKDEGLPADLGHLVWIESAFNVEAKSVVGALGL